MKNSYKRFLSYFSIDSLKAKINLIFTIAYILLLMLFVALWQSSTKSAMQDIQQQEKANIHYLYLYFLKYGKIDKDYLLSQNIRIVDIGGKHLKLKKEIEDISGNKRFAAVNINLHRYILIDNDRFHLILENLNKPRFPFELTIAFMGAFILLIILYFWIIRSIKPLFELKSKIIKFSQGDLNIHCKSDKDDEIGAVANALDEAVSKIRDLVRARQLMLRAVMHELKTPIAKGRFLSEMIDENCKKERFHAIFERLNLLIDEFAKVEQVSSKNFSTNMKRYKMSDILDGSIDMLMLDNPNQYIHLVLKKDITINADFELLTLAIKNLIDNAIKYSIDHKVNILLDYDILEISNEGKPLKGKIEDYFTPFHESRSGLGLGLYIVKSILDVHNMNLSYKYEDNRIYFIIKSKDIEFINQSNKMDTSVNTSK